MKRRIIQIAGLVMAAGCIVAGIMTGEVKTVFAKAVRICLECIGLGVVALVVSAGLGFANPDVVSADEKKVVVCDNVSCMQVAVTVPNEMEIEAGKQKAVPVTFSKTVDKKITFKSTNKKKATVNKLGVIKAKKRGVVTIKTTVKCTGAKQKITFKTKVTIA